MTTLYRKWRSQSFDDLYGQDHVVRTLRNAIKQGRVAHAYLFTGPRGTGKTSTARILAKAVNCLDPQDGGPCNQCAHCVAANQGRAIDVIEIDAASNTSVDNVRDLRERVAYAAGEGRYKVYIVDEVHRLSGAAFDAFLKTLEEPPPHVIFVFASTEPHKVPATITSRCQRFDFRRIPPAASMARLREVSGEENLVVTEEALQLVVLHANGSLRDALGVLDQVSAYTRDEIGADQVREALGLADPGMVARLTDALLGGTPGAGLNEFEQYVDAGGDPRQLVRQFIDYWRALLLAASGSRPSELDPALVPYLNPHAKMLDTDRVVQVIRIMTELDFSPRYNLPAQLPFELAYVEAGLAVKAPGMVAAVETARPSALAPLGRDLTSTDGTRSASSELLPPAPVPAVPSESVPAPPAKVEPQPTENRAMGPVSDVGVAWPRILEAMRLNRSLQAVLKSGYPVLVEGGQMTIGLPYEWHVGRFADIKAVRVVEEAVAAVMGASYRVKCVLTPNEEIKRLRAGDGHISDDGFVEELERRLQQFHVHELNGRDS